MNLVDELRLRDLDQDEVLDLLTRHCGDATGDGTAWTMGGGVNEYEVRFDRDDWLDSIVPGVNAQPATLINRIDSELRASAGTRFGTEILFTTGGSVGGGWRHAEQFQILPAPTEFPRPPFSLAEFPFLLQYAYQASSAWQVNSVRRSKVALRLERLLSVLIPNRVARSGGRHLWALVPELEQPASYRSEYLQPGFLPDWNPPSDDEFMSLAPFRPIDQGGPSRHDGGGPSRTIVGDDRVVLPANVDQIAEGYLALEVDEQRTFDRAAGYFHLAQKSAEPGLTWVALVGAIESLTPSSTAAPCPTCNRPVQVGELCDDCKQGDGATRQFRETLATLVPSLSQDERRARTRLYNTRSGFAHGSLSLDRGAGFGVETTGTLRRESDLRYGFSLVRAALMNWLLVIG